MDFRTRLGLQQLDGRGLPSVTAVAEPPTGHHHGVDDRHGSDVNVASPQAAVACACEAGGLTAEQQQLLDALRAQLNALNADVLAVETEQIRLQDQRTQINSQIGVLNGQSVNAYKAVIATQNKLDDFVKAHTTREILEDPKLLEQYAKLLTAAGNARGQVEALEAAIATFNGQIAALNLRITSLNERAVQLRAQREAIRDQIADLLKLKSDQVSCECFEATEFGAVAV